MIFQLFFFQGRGGRGTMSRGRGGAGGGPQGVVGGSRGRAPVPPPLTRGGGRGSRGGGRGAGGPPQLRGGAGQQRGNLAGKRKFDGGHQNQGDSKRRFPNSSSSPWGSQPIPQQPLDSGGYGYGQGSSDAQWYQDSYGQQWG